MSWDRRLGVGALIVAFLSIASFYLWPDEKWIGWLCLLAALTLGAMWLWLETRPHRGFMATIGLFTIIGAASGGVVGAIAGAVWFATHKSPAPATKTDELSQKPTPAPPPPVAPTTEEQARKIVQTIIDRYIKRHKSPPTEAWINSRLAEQGQTFTVRKRPTEKDKQSLAPPRTDHAAVRVEDSSDIKINNVDATGMDGVVTKRSQRISADNIKVREHGEPPKK
jgi:hypothetical protein